MPDTAHARLALRRLVAGLIGRTTPAPFSDRTIDDLLAMLDTDEAADLRAVLDALEFAEMVTGVAAQTPRFVYAEKDRDYRTGSARGYVVLDLITVDVDGCEAELLASCPTLVHARTLAATLNEHPPQFSPDVPTAYDDEPF